MEKVKLIQIDPIDATDLSIILDCEIDTDGNIPLNDVSVIASVYDTTDNFIFQKRLKGEDFKFDYNSENELLLYMYEELLNIDDNEDLNPGVYRIRFSFIIDTFNAIENEDNRFIVTEISSDGSEIRLNPLSNDEDFINTFSRFKRYEKTDKEIELTTTGFIKFLRNYNESVFSDANINEIFSDTEVVVYGKPLSQYLAKVFYERLDLVITNDTTRLREAEKKAEDAIERLKSLLKSKKGDSFIFLNQYFETVKDGLFLELKNTDPLDDQSRIALLNDFKLNIKNKMEEFLNDSISEIIDLVLIN